MGFLPAQEQLKRLKQGIVDLVSEKELLAKLEKSVKTGKPLRVKAGFDPSAPDLHLGHAVLINKMRQFQLLGHDVIFLIGDITGMVGDPSGKNETRKALTREEVQENGRTYAKQIFKLLDPHKTIIEYNSRWFEKFDVFEIFKLCGQYTVARMLERDDFSKRFKSSNPISIHEFLYPLLQGYDSVALHADVELGGNDQRFNLLVGRDMQKSYGQEPQVVLTVPLLEGLDGVNKMSKSHHNYIGVDENSRDMFGKTMRLSDELMMKYYELLTDITPDELAKLKSDMSSGKTNPRDVKVRLAKEFVTRYHSAEAAEKEAQSFFEVFSNKGMPSDIQEWRTSPMNEIWICKLLVEVGAAQSTSEAKRLVEGGGVTRDGEKIVDSKLKFDLKPGDQFILKAGKKKFVKVVVH
ncbi:MAG: tyrosine--tRNA ligase [Oligoflexia bacterium]|nr:tyrosine--tRNA ligase [Oligoflexia bacterium]